MTKRALILIWTVLLLAACGSAGSQTVHEFSVAYPETNLARVILEINSGMLNINSGAGESITGSAVTNVDAWRPAIAQEANGVVRIRQGATRSQVIPTSTNEWTITLGDAQPLNLEVNAGSAGGSLNLGGLPLNDVVVRADTGSFSIGYERAAEVDTAGAITVTTSSGNLEMTRVLNSQARAITTTSRSGTQILDFSGTLAHDMSVTATSSTGTVTLRVQRGIPTRVIFNTTSGVVREVAPEFERVETSVFQTDDYDTTDGPRLLIEVTTVFGDFRLVSVNAS